MSASIVQIHHLWQWHNIECNIQNDNIIPNDGPHNLTIVVLAYLHEALLCFYFNIFICIPKWPCMHKHPCTPPSSRFTSEWVVDFLLVMHVWFIRYCPLCTSHPCRLLEVFPDQNVKSHLIFMMHTTLHPSSRMIDNILPQPPIKCPIPRNFLSQNKRPIV